LIVFLVIGVIFTSGVYLGGIGGYKKGTAISSITARSAMSASNANNLAISLKLVASANKNQQSVKFLLTSYEGRLISSLEEYYTYQDIEAYTNDPLRKHNLFTLIHPNDLKPVIDYVKEIKTKEEIKAVPVYTKLLNEESN